MKSTTTTKETTMKARYMVYANGKEFTFEGRTAARSFAAEYNTIPVRVNLETRPAGSTKRKVTQVNPS
jgi:hypothetical protein